MSLFQARSNSDVNLDENPHANTKRDANAKSRSQNLEKYLPQNVAKAFWRRVLGLLYSFSLVILMLLTFAFVMATPLDVIIQTRGTSSMGIKVFIIVVFNAFFLFASLVYYFTRLIHTRVLINQIPSKSVYLPLETHDLPKKTLAYTMKNFSRCIGDIKVKAGPLQNEAERFDYPGMAPPLYIQQRNMRLGFQAELSSLPKDCIFEDIVNSIGLKVKVDGLLAGNFTIPKNYTFREVMLAIGESLDDKGLLDPDWAAMLSHVIADYEQFKFGPDMASHDEIVAFFSNLEMFMNRFINSSTGEMCHDDVLSDPTRRNSAYTGLSFGNTLSVGSRADSHDETLGQSQLDSDTEDEIALRPTSFLDPLEYFDDAGSVRRRSSSNFNSGFGLGSILTSRSRENRENRASGESRRTSVDQSIAPRRPSSQWSAFRRRLNSTGGSDST